MLICETKMLSFDVKVAKIMPKKGTALIKQLYINHLEKIALFSVYTSADVEIAKNFHEKIQNIVI